MINLEKKTQKEKNPSPGGHSVVNNMEGGGGDGLIVWDLEFLLGKDILGFFKNIDLDNSQG